EGSVHHHDWVFLVRGFADYDSRLQWPDSDVAKADRIAVILKSDRPRLANVFVRGPGRAVRGERGILDDRDAVVDNRQAARNHVTFGPLARTVVGDVVGLPGLRRLVRARLRRNQTVQSPPANVVWNPRIVNHVEDLDLVAAIEVNAAV